MLVAAQPIIITLQSLAPAVESTDANRRASNERGPTYAEKIRKLKATLWFLTMGEMHPPARSVGRADADLRRGPMGCSGCN